MVPGHERQVQPTLRRVVAGQRLGGLVSVGAPGERADGGVHQHLKVIVDMRNPPGGSPVTGRIGAGDQDRPGLLQGQQPGDGFGVSPPLPAPGQGTGRIPVAGDRRCEDLPNPVGQVAGTLRLVGVLVVQAKAEFAGSGVVRAAVAGVIGRQVAAGIGGAGSGGVRRILHDHLPISVRQRGWWPLVDPSTRAAVR